jgi:hypothetical protein
MPAPNRTAAPPPANTPVFDAFAQQLGALAAKYKITTLAIVAVDPQTGDQKLYASPGAIAATRELVAEKYDLMAMAETAWNDT